MNMNNSVSTSADPSMVGADADLYIGMVQNVQVTLWYILPRERMPTAISSTWYVTYR